MTDWAQALLREAPALADDEPADLAAELLRSLEGPVPEEPESVRDAWVREIPWQRIEDGASRSA